MRDFDLAYLAGMIDGDGYISIARSERNGSYYFGPQIGISGTRRQPHDLAASIWGGKVSLYFPKNINHRPQYQWSRQGAVAAVAIKEILPHLRVKHEHAQLALECWDFLEETREENPFPWFSSDYNPLVVLNDMRETMIEMNQSKNKRRPKIS